jgi:hypothetical protein
MLSISISHLYPDLSIYLPIYLPTYLPTYLPIYPSIYLSIYVSICICTVFISIYMYIYLSIYLYIYYLSIYICICRARAEALCMAARLARGWLRPRGARSVGAALCRPSEPLRPNTSQVMLAEAQKHMGRLSSIGSACAALTVAHGIYCLPPPPPPSLPRPTAFRRPPAAATAAHRDFLLVPSASAQAPPMGRSARAAPIDALRTAVLPPSRRDRLT